LEAHRQATSGQVGGDDAGGAPVETAAGTVVAHGRARAGVRGGFLYVPERNPGVESGGDERMPQCAMISARVNRLPDTSRRFRRLTGRGKPMGKVVAGITISVDGFITGPGDGPGCGLGIGGERLHYWVFGGPWSYDSPGRGEPTGEDKAWLEETIGANGAVIAGRGTYEAAGHWGDENPWGIPFFVVTHRPAEQPPAGDFVFVGSLAGAIDQAKAAAGEKQVHVMGGADLIRQALAAGLVDELTIIIAPVTLGAGKRLFDGFGESLELEHLGVRQSPFATFIDYRVKK
jgi:dihydrofolate reductase